MADTKIMTQEEITAEERNRRMAILKASNEMLRQAQETAMRKTTDKLGRQRLEQQFNKAIEENNLKGKNLLNADVSEIEQATYREPDQEYIEKFKKRLEKKGITEEELYRKEEATITIGKASKGQNSVRRIRKGSKKNLGSDYTPIENEEEIMKATLVTSESQIEEQKRKNREIEEQMQKDQFDKMSQVKNQIKNIASLGKETINTQNAENAERVTLDVEKKDVLNAVSSKESSKSTQNAEVQEKQRKKKVETKVIKYDFDFSSIPSYVQYDVIPLPSKGMCYPKDNPLRCGRVPVAYLTASDENIITSPNVYRDGKLFDIILSRKILDKRIKVSDLNSGDRDAIILWLRATAYGEDFPITVTNPKTEKKYNITIKLSQFDYLDFNLESDDDGLFTFNTTNGDEIKFKFFTADDEEELRKKIRAQIADVDKIEILRNLGNIAYVMNLIDFNEEDKQMLVEDVEEIREIVGQGVDEINDSVYPNTITEQMIQHTVSVNGNTDKEHVKSYIENMRAKESREYRTYFLNNKPGVDFNFTVNIPESDGGGSFTTFLRLSDTIFINI